MIYLDNAATRKPTQQAIETFCRFMSEGYANASSSHALGRYAQRHLDDARKRCADTLGCDTSNIFFTSCASESNSQIIETAALYGTRTQCKHIVSTSIEHSSVLQSLRELAKRGFEISYAKPNRNGNVEADAVIDLIRSDTCFVSVMLVNNETGAIQDIKAVSEYCRERNILFHTDVTQGVGMPQMLDLKKSCIDFLSLSGHKLGAGLGAGLLYMSKNAMRRMSSKTPKALIQGHQEYGARGGTYNLPAIVSLSEELVRECREYRSDESKTAELEKEFLISLRQKVPFSVNCTEKRKPGILSVRFDIQAGPLVEYLSSNGIYVSSGSACLSGTPEPSYVLQEMRLSQDEMNGTVRFSIKHDEPLFDLLETANKIYAFRVKVMKNT